LSEEAFFEPANNTYPFGCHISMLEVDRETGEPKLLRLVAVDDAGNASTSDPATASIEPPDAGLALFDGGVEEVTDAGLDSPRSLAVGCGCGAAPAGVLAALLLLGVAWLRRSRR